MLFVVPYCVTAATGFTTHLHSDDNNNNNNNNNNNSVYANMIAMFVPLHVMGIYGYSMGTWPTAREFVCAENFP
jgi:hypothetical protein